jgi:very-short-patch-repair endonuclease
MSQNIKTPHILSVFHNAMQDISGTQSGGNSNAKYASTVLARDSSLSVLAQQANPNIGGNISTPPGFYSPFLTQSAFQIPNNRKEVYLWAAFFYDNDPKVAAGINFYTDFIFSGFKLECKSTYIKDYFDKLCKKLNFSKWLPLISQEYHLRGDCFTFLSLDCTRCKGSNINDDTGEACTHDGATWMSISIIDPNQVEISPAFIDKEPSYYFVPTDQMIKIVTTGAPENQFKMIPEHMKKMIIQKQPIYLEPACITHFKRASSPWTPYGTSLVRSIFPVLAYKDKLRQAQYTIAERHVLPVRIVKVGNAERPANEADIQNVQEQLAARANDPLLTIVTHHAFEYEWVGAGSAVLNLSGEHEQIESDLLDGLMISKQVIAGEGPQYGGNIGLLALDRRLERFRMEVAEWMEEKVFKPVAERNGFTIKNSNGEDEIVYPTVKWNDLQLRDETSRLQTLQAMQQSNILSAQTLIEALGLNYDQEVERLRFEQSSGFGAEPGAGGMGGSMLGGIGGGFSGGMPGGGGAVPPMEGGLDAGGLDAGGLDNTMGGMSPMNPPAIGQPPAGAPVPTAKSKTDNFKFSNNLIFNVVTARQNNNVSKASQFKSAAHKAYVDSISPVTGRGFNGVLDKKFIPLNEDILMPPDGGTFCMPMNALAVREYSTVIKRPAVMAKKKDENLQQAKLFTELEQMLYTIVLNLNIPLPVYAQLAAGPSQEYQLDAAYPSIKLGIEADSETFHAGNEQIQRDKHRDAVLAGEGWTILRFTDKELRDKQDEVGQVVLQVVQQLISHIYGV